VPGIMEYVTHIPTNQRWAGYKTSIESPSQWNLYRRVCIINGANISNRNELLATCPHTLACLRLLDD